MADNINERTLLLKKLQACEFALIELGLYLDTHPDDKSALAYYSKFQTTMKELSGEYAKKYSPLRMEDVANDSYWDWIENPWPWELERGV